MGEVADAEAAGGVVWVVPEDVGVVEWVGLPGAVKETIVRHLLVAAATTRWYDRDLKAGTWAAVAVPGILTEVEAVHSAEVADTETIFEAVVAVVVVVVLAAVLAVALLIAQDSSREAAAAISEVAAVRDRGEKAGGAAVSRISGN